MYAYNKVNIIIRLSNKKSNIDIKDKKLQNSEDTVRTKKAY